MAVIDNNSEVLARGPNLIDGIAKLFADMAGDVPASYRVTCPQHTR